MPNGPHGLLEPRVESIVSWDDGSGAGEALYATGVFDSAGGVPLTGLGRWHPSTGWSSFGDAEFSGHVLRVLQLPSDARPMLYLGGAFSAVNGVQARGVARFDGANWTALGNGLYADGSGSPDGVQDLAAFDDGTGLKLYAALNGFLNPITGVYVFDGAAWSRAGTPPYPTGGTSTLATYHDGTSNALYAGGYCSGVTRVWRFDGTSWTSRTGHSTWNLVGTVASLAVYDDGAGPALFVGGFWNWPQIGWLERLDATAVTPVALNVAGGVYDLAVDDDLSGSTLCVAGGFDSIGGTTSPGAARWNGSTWSNLGTGFASQVAPLGVISILPRTDPVTGQREVVAAGRFDVAGGNGASNLARLVECQRNAFCFGDGALADHTTACPCGNNGVRGSGCAHSFDARGASLVTTGVPSHGDVALHAQSLPATSFTLFIQHTSVGDTIFHDGVLCAGGTLVRLRGRAAAAGQAQFPNSLFAQDSTTTLAQRGGVFPGQGVRRYYSGWYRNASSTFCPPATANVTNGCLVDW